GGGGAGARRRRRRRPAPEDHAAAIDVPASAFPLGPDETSADDKLAESSRCVRRSDAGPMAAPRSWPCLRHVLDTRDTALVWFAARVRRRLWMAPGSPDSALRTRMRAIDADGRDEAARLLAASPALARAGRAAGATRGSETAFFLGRIRRHVYAGDTALHVAAAAYWKDFAQAL